jgi:hypothetical protein
VYHLTIEVMGSGSVTRSPDAAAYAPGAAVQLTAHAAAGYQFAGWSGDTSSTWGSLGLTMNRDWRVVAAFVTTDPEITTVEDIPDDQGRTVEIAWLRAAADRSTAPRRVRRYTISRRDSVPGDWTLVAEVTATGQSAYSMTVPTLGDSNLTGVEWSVFRIRGETNTPGLWYESDPDSGFSIDNLPPAEPTMFPPTFSYPERTTHLRWRQNLESDSWQYWLFRGGSLDFVPDAASLIAALEDTMYSDSVGAPGSYYKLGAVDVNGNVGPYAVATMAVLLDAAGSGSIGLALESIRPNPVRGGALTVSLTLPTSDPATLEVIDVTGRRVAGRSVGSLGRGRHTVHAAENLRLAPGVYFVRLRQGRHVRTARVVVLH